MGFHLEYLYLAVIVAFLSSQSPSFCANSSILLNDTQKDKDALLSFKSQIIITDPSHYPLSSWNTTTNFCNWTGVICNKFNITQRVIGLDLRGLRLSGTITPHLGNLSFLRYLHLQDNQFTGTLPNSISDLSRLQVLNMSSNNIGGEIPLNISKCSELTILDLMGNKISGRIPSELEHLSKLQILQLSKNQFSGPIPSSIGNISSLTTLDVGTNSLGGTIPIDFGLRLQKLQILKISINNLTGIVPPSMYNISSLVFFDMASNRLWGDVPSDLGDKLPNLLDFHNCINRFTGRIPRSLHNLTKIQRIRMSWNFLDGPVPPGLGNLPDLRMYNIGYNRIVSTGDSGLSFITSLTNSTLLEFLAIDGNLLEGVIPESIGNLSTALSKLYMGGNRIYGSIPGSIGHLQSLALLNLSYNSITGEIPSEIGKLTELQRLVLAGNKLSGEIPESIANLSKLNELELFGNELVGRIPTSFGKFKHLLSLDLSENRLNGSIPREVFRLSSLSLVLNLSMNSLNGPLPQEVEILKDVVEIDLSNNQLSGSIPDTIGNCRSLQVLFMARNLFSGHIPNALGQVKGLDSLDLSLNQLSGPIPDDLQQLKSLQLLNLSFNNLQGAVPKDGIFRNLSNVHLEGNSQLLCWSPASALFCGNENGRKRSSATTRTIFLIAGGAIILLLCLLVGAFLYGRKHGAVKTKEEENLLKNRHQMVSYEELRTATSNFNGANLIGTGSFGSVYKGILREGMAIAVKVLDLNQTGASKSFLAECEALKNIRHRNLVKLITSCSSVDFGNVDFLALVYEFMGNGNLEDWVHGRRRSLHDGGGDGFNVAERLNVAIDVARAMDYMHHDCVKPVVHCDLKPSNILLDEDMTAKVGDFGLARVLMDKRGSDGQSTSTYGLKGSIGYIPPEYGFGGKPSTRGDVYSYGVMLLELFTGRRPTHESFVGELSLVKWVESAFPTNVVQVLDPELVLLMGGGVRYEDQPISPRIDQQECLVSIISVGLSCTVNSPDDRISMRDVLHKLKGIRDTLLKPTIKYTN